MSFTIGFRAPDAAQRRSSRRGALQSRGRNARRRSQRSRLCGATQERCAASGTRDRTKGHPSCLSFGIAMSPKSRLEPCRARPRQPTVNGFGRESCSQGSGNADSQRKAWNSRGSGPRRSFPRDSGCAHPAHWRAAASYRPLRAVWARAPGTSGDRRSIETRAPRTAHHLKEFIHDYRT